MDENVDNVVKVPTADTKLLNPTPEQITEVYINLVKASGQRDVCPQIHLINQDVVNAFTTKEGIFLFKGLLDKLTTLDELALIIGHELSHYLLGHVNHTQPTSINLTRIQECQADKYGGFLMMRAGYNICKGRNMLVIFKDLFGDGMDDDHPDDAFRFEQLDVNCDGPF